MFDVYKSRLWWTAIAAMCHYEGSERECWLSLMMAEELKGERQ